MRDGPRLRGLPVFSAAMAGFVLGHTIAYLIAVPDPHQRQFVLQQSGHGYMPALTQVVLMAAVAGVAALVARAFGGRGEQTETFPSLARTLGAVQVVAFLGQEVLERVVAHVPLQTLANDRLLLTGVLVQVLVAVAGAAILRWLWRTTTRLAEGFRVRLPLPRPRIVFAMPGVAWLPVASVIATPGKVRAPPSS